MWFHLYLLSWILPLLKPGSIFCWTLFFLVVSSSGKCLGVTLIDGKSFCLLSEFPRWKFTQLTNCFIYCNRNKRRNCAEEAVWGQIPWDVISLFWLLLCLQGLHLLQFITHFLIKQVRKSRFISFTLLFPQGLLLSTDPKHWKAHFYVCRGFCWPAPATNCESLLWFSVRRRREESDSSSAWSSMEQTFVPGNKWAPELKWFSN